MNRNRAIEISYFLLRAVSGFLLWQSGCTKLFGWFGGMPPGMPPISLTSQIGIGAILELVGGFLVMVGLFTRPAAFIVSGMMAVAYWQFHFKPELPWPTMNGGVAAVLLCFIFLYVSAAGGGEWSLDAWLRRRRGVPSEG